VKKALANSEPSTHGTERTSRHVRSSVAIGGKADILCSVRAFPLLTDTVENSTHKKAVELEFETIESE
jgi:hypothetical protein